MATASLCLSSSGASACILLTCILLSTCPVTLTSSPLHDQVCDSVLSGEVGVKYSLRLTEPVSSRFHKFHCDITFEPPTINSLGTSRNPSSHSTSASSLSPVKHESHPDRGSPSLFASTRSKLGIDSEASGSSFTNEGQSSGSPIRPAAKSTTATATTTTTTTAFDAINGAKDNSLITGDVIELTFLSFQVGSFELTKENEGVCSKGHLTIKEKPWASSKASPGNSFTSPSYLNGDSADSMESGRFCGQMMSRKAVYYSSSNSTVTLSVYLPPPNPFFGHSSHFSLFLFYKFVSSASVKTAATSTASPSSNGPNDFTLKSSPGIHEKSSLGQRKTLSSIHHQDSSPSVSSSTSNSHGWSARHEESTYNEVEETYGSTLNPQQAHLHLHPWNSKSNCDVIFDSCVPPKVCTILSPNFPGFYLRNVTCNYWFRESNVPSGYKGYYIIQSKPNDERLSLSPVASELSSVSQAIVPSNIVSRERSTNWSSESLLFDPSICSSFDSITIFSGRNPGNSSAIVSRFCSNGKLPVIITPISSASSTSSQRDGMVIVFKSTSNSLLFDSRFQLSVQAIFIPSVVSGARSHSLPTEANLTGATESAVSSLYPFFVSPFSSSLSAPCDIAIDAEQVSSHSIEVSETPVRRSGALSLPLINFHTPVTINSTCTVRFISKQPTDRIWISLSPIGSHSGAQSSSRVTSTAPSTPVSSVTTDYLEQGECFHSNSYQIFGSLIRMQMPVTRLNESHYSECSTPVPSNLPSFTPVTEQQAASHVFNVKQDDQRQRRLTSAPRVDLCEATGDTASTNSYQSRDLCSWQDGFLSAGASVMLKKTFRSTPALFAPFLVSSSSQISTSAQFFAKLLPVNGFTVKYEFVDLKEYGDPVANSVCDRIIRPPSSRSSLKGVVASTRNTFLFARGSGRRHLSCSYELTNERLHKIKIHFTSIRLSSHSCTTAIDPATNMYTCSHSSSSSSVSPSSSSESSATLSTLTVFDSINSDQSVSSASTDSTVSPLETIQIGCLCSSPVERTRKPANRATSGISKPLDSDLIESSLLRDSVTFEAVGPSVIINFTVVNMQPEDDFVRFGFHARYEYISPPAGPVLDSSSSLEHIHADISESQAASERADDVPTHSPGASHSACSSAISLGKKHASHGHLLIDRGALAAFTSHARQQSVDSFGRKVSTLVQEQQCNQQQQQHQEQKWGHATQVASH